MKRSAFAIHLGSWGLEFSYKEVFFHEVGQSLEVRAGGIVFLLGVATEPILNS